MRNLRFFITAIMLLVSVVARANIPGFGEHGITLKPNGGVVLSYLAADSELTIWCPQVGGYCDDASHAFIDIDSYGNHGCGITEWWYGHTVRCWTWNQAWDMQYPSAEEDPIMVATNANGVMVVNQAGELWHKFFGSNWNNIGAQYGAWYWVDGNANSVCGAYDDHVQCFDLFAGQALPGLDVHTSGPVITMAMNDTEVAFDDGAGTVVQAELYSPYRVTYQPTWAGASELAGSGNTFCANLSNLVGAPSISCWGRMSAAFSAGPSGEYVGLAMTTLSDGRDCFAATWASWWYERWECSP